MTMPCDADIYDDLIARRVHTSDAEKFAEICPCPCNGAGWGMIWYVFSSIGISKFVLGNKQGVFD